MRRRLLLLAPMLASPALVRAAAWPTRPVRLIMPGGPGGNPDIVARLWAQRLSERLGQPVMVENRPGAAGIIGTEAAMNAAPDGHTMLFGYNQLVTLNPLLYRRLPYDVSRMTRVSLVSEAPFVMLAPMSLPARNVGEFVALAKAAPGRLAFGTAGPGTFAHLSGEILMREAGIELLHVPHRQTPRNELIAGQVQACFEPSALAITLAGGPEPKVRALAVMGQETLPELPGVPLMAESYPGFVVQIFHGLWGPPGMAPEAVAGMSAAVAELARDPWLLERMAPLATKVIGAGPAALEAAMVRDLALWAPVIRDRDIRLD
ncbi:tripartite tricarboxylate transporter substrate binding protein [Siccirubricoccus sp. KC 17139]|uniref:Tripartite tricarboxylate transporter substrate binding protein n=1 Tax=Siccirubricoccus soli TaxID=2899147 RepID=A0ABT1D9Y3_9PROT|nr:tripartite tricarboxylate transporter substrate binding protein [Siccirubricoccus soli]MCO6418745.1 tripartite tricarboxylate transporter substrate binding protein [Siccirubricoccus soli]MCP2684880.1 tripartite tricarboxylate transporter substrate binding protein [Siccirubricoccus soli]